ncbi:MAG: CehA/McbA family metallohydrolase [Bradymonadaceae bacterium]|nr:CehA/McbA family metallohydrolase [Lujinxingiaceae bacterium]
MFESPRSISPHVFARERRRFGMAALVALAILLGMIFFAACGTEEREARATAQRVTSRSQLIGGPTALGEVGDFLLENDQIRLVIQDRSFNRGAGLFGGSLIDADLVRADGKGNAMGGNGRDSFGELFPAFFLEMIDPEAIVIVNDGSDGKAAIIEVQGRGGEFITMLRFFNQAMVNSYEANLSDAVRGKPATSDTKPLVTFSTRYILEPGARHVRIESSLTNNTYGALDFPNAQIGTALRLATGIDFSQFRVPTGHVIGFGALNKLFATDIGFDLRFGLDAAYEKGIELPAMPGHVTNLLATTGSHGLSYGFATAPDPESNFVFNKKEHYGEHVRPDDMLLLFYASGFGAVYTSHTPKRLAPAFCQADKSAEVRCEEIEAQCSAAAECVESDDPSQPRCSVPLDCTAERTRCTAGYPACLVALEAGLPSSYTFTNYFILGNGDVASIRDEHYRIQEKPAEKQLAYSVHGRVYDEFSGSPVTEPINVLIYKAGANGACDTATDAAPLGVFSQSLTSATGHFEFRIEPGKYCHRVRGSGRPLGDLVAMTVEAKALSIRPIARSGGRIEATIVDVSGRPLPAKMTIVGTYTPKAGVAPRKYLFDLGAGETWRTSEQASYTDTDVAVRPFIETVAFAGADGRVHANVPPGKYTAYFSRGTEYELEKSEIEVVAGGVARASARLRRVIVPEGYMSGDFHMHAMGSIDSGLDYNERVISIAAEGVDLVVSSDHNYISDYAPYIVRNDLSPWLKSVIGLELTTFEGGHFNAFPLKREIDQMNRGSMGWQDKTPEHIFNALRSAGSLGADKTIIQVNHPRDSILGYFSQHNMDAFTTKVDLKFNNVPGNEVLTATLSTPSGPAFIKACEDNPAKFCSTFSWDFDAIEVFNGKRMELLRHYRMPYEPDALPEHIREQLSDEEIAALPPKGTILCDKNKVAYPGGLDDWYNLLNYPRPDGSYRMYSATGNSDSHHAGSPGDSEPGYPRNYFFVGHNDVERLTDATFTEAVLARHMIVTNGPFINMTVNNNPVGSVNTTKESTVAVTLSVQAADWVGAERYRLIANGELVREGAVSLKDGRWEDTLAITITGDTWFVLEVEGDNNLFPIIMPDDQGRASIDAAVGSLADSFGLGGGIAGLEPDDTFHVTPFAFTNPIWVIRDSAGTRKQFEPAQPPAARCRNGTYQPGALVDPQVFEHLGQRLDAVNIPVHTHKDSIIDRTKGETRDLRLLFEVWGGHGH